MSIEGLTERQSEILHWVNHHMQFHGYPPTRSEIANQFGFRSPNAAEDHLRSMERRGFLVIRPGIARGLSLTYPARAGIAADIAADIEKQRLGETA